MRTFYTTGIVLFLLVSISIQCDTKDFTETAFQEDITYQQHIGPIVASNCMPCHSSQSALGSLVLETQNQVVEAIEERNLLGRIQDNPGPVMPPSGLMPVQNVNAFIDWQANGFPTE